MIVPLFMVRVSQAMAFDTRTIHFQKSISQEYLAYCKSSFILYNPHFSYDFDEIFLEFD